MARLTNVVWLALAAIVGTFYPIDTSAEELVAFNSAPYRLGHLQERLARERGETSKPSEAIEGYLSKPEGSGPFPAIVYLHGCGGLSENTRKHVARLLTGWGYVSLAVDSFSTRGIKEACTARMPNREGDALGALSYLSKLAFVDPQRVAVIGASQGGVVALQLGSRGTVRETDVFEKPEELNFKAVVAYYPMCRFASNELTLPTLILIGELDDWASASDCKEFVKRGVGRGAPVNLIVYPGAYHDFNIPALVEGRKMFGHWLKYDADAAASSVQALHNFLSAQLSH